jgi:hypothetical protein
MGHFPREAHEHFEDVPGAHTLLDNIARADTVAYFETRGDRGAGEIHSLSDRGREMDDSKAERLIAEAVERVGGARMVVGSPRHPFSMNSTREEAVDGYTVTIHYSEISSPAIATVDGWVFEIREDEFVLLSKPRR